MKISTLIILVAVVIATPFVLQKCSFKKTAQNENLIMVGTCADYAPFEFIDDAGEFTGFEMEIIKEISKKINIKIQIKNMQFEMLIPDLQLGRLDIIAAGITPTPERSQQMNFSKPTLDKDPLLIISPKNQPINDINELQGKDVLVNAGYTADLFMSKKNGINLKRLPTVADAFLALRNNDAAAFVTAKTAVAPFFQKYGKDEFNIVEIPEIFDSYAFGISNRKPELLEKINKAITEMEEDGTLAQIKTKWGLND
ncbi:MAG: Extracellular solute-binding protein family 3 [candidate division TM6 bacterium GW2011_GWF2_32_72]|nr:MAG: Extracellular solute-binding protein family 3 [candidate division TM6 bacterium GW2011_GWF2_32_72]